MHPSRIRYFFLILLMSIAAGTGFGQEPRGLSVVAAPLAGDNALIGRQIAAFIAVDRYREWMPLRNPVSDARAIGTVLQSRYFVDDLYELYDEDATRTGIVRLFEKLIAETRPEDSVFLYYAGHGHLDSLSGTGSWIPQDAGLDTYEQRGWLPNSTLRGLISRMKARHVVLVSDSCFSGDILNVNRSAPPVIDNEYFRRAYARRSRQVLSSGSSETVVDDSSFSRALIRALEENRAPYLDPVMLFQEIRLSVTGQTPLMGSLRDTDSQDGGSFILFLKDKAGSGNPGDAKNPGRTATPSSYRPVQAVGRLDLTLDPPDAGCALTPFDPAGGPNPVQIPAFLSSGSVELPPGQYRLTVMKDGYRDLTIPVTLAAGRVLPVTARLQRQAPGKLILPELGVELQLTAEGKQLDAGAIPAGLELTLGFSSHQAFALDLAPVKLRLGEGESRKLEIPAGSFRLPLLADDAEVLVAGRPLKSPPRSSPGSYVSPLLPPGEYMVSVTGDYAWQGKVRVGEGSVSEVQGYRDAVLHKLSTLRSEAERKVKAIPGKRSAGTVSLVAGLAGAAGSVATYVLGRQAFESYTTSTDPAEISRAKEMIGLYGMLLPVSASVGGLGLVLSPILFSGTDPRALEESIQALDEKIRALGR